MSDNIPKSSRDDLLIELKLARQRLRSKALNGKIFDESKERIRIGWMQTWIKAIQAEAAILKDVELDDLKEEIEKVKKQLNEKPLTHDERSKRLKRIEGEGDQYAKIES